MDLARQTQCSLIIDGEDAFRRSVMDVICKDSAACCLHELKSVDINTEIIASLGPAPDIIFFRLKPEERKGIHLIKEIKDDPELKYIPLVCVVNRNRAEDVNLCYGNFANCCIEMLDHAEKMKNRIMDTWQFWQEIVKLPRHFIPTI